VRATIPLTAVFEGWEGYNRSLIHAVEPLTVEQLGFRPAPGLRSVGQVAAHIALGRFDWFSKMGAPGCDDLSLELDSWRDDEGRSACEEALADSAANIVHWLNRSWAMVDRTLTEWTVDDLAKWYPHTYWGKTYAVSHQWTIWRIMAHDIQHGGQLSAMLAILGIEPDELTGLGGHLTEPPQVTEMKG